MNHKVFGISFPFESPFWIKNSMSCVESTRLPYSARLKKMAGQPTPPTPPLPAPPEVRLPYDAPPTLREVQLQQYVWLRGGPRPQSMSSSSNSSCVNPEAAAGSADDLFRDAQRSRRSIRRSRLQQQMMVDEQQTHGAAVDAATIVPYGAAADDGTMVMESAIVAHGAAEAAADDGVVVMETAIVVHGEAADDADLEVGHGEQSTMQTHVPPTSHLYIPDMPSRPPPPFYPPQWPEVYKLVGERNVFSNQIERCACLIVTKW